MIVRELKENPDKVLQNFDYYNDYEDTKRWADYNCPDAIVQRLEAGYHRWIHETPQPLINPDYKPYNDQWKNHMMKHSKREIIEITSRALQKKNKRIAELEKELNTHPTFFISLLCRHDTREVYFMHSTEESHGIPVWGEQYFLSPSKSQAVYNHSPDGFSWGYHGSGCAQLALAVCLELVDKDTALRNYQKFKELVIAKGNMSTNMLIENLQIPPEFWK